MNEVMACVDALGHPLAVCDGAAWAARTLGARLMFLHVLERHPERASSIDFSGQIGLGAQESVLNELAELDGRRSALAQKEGRRILEGMRQRALESGIDDIELRQRHGELADTVVELETSTTLVVMGEHTHPPGTGRFLDHHLEQVIRATHRPVLVVPRHTFQAPRSFALAYDGSETAQALLRQVTQNPLLQGLPCQVIRVGPADPAMQAELDAGAQALREAGMQAEAQYLVGDIEQVLPMHLATQGLGLLVMGAYGHSRIRHLIVGSTTTALLRNSEVPVLVLR